ncbi:hypothetical protein C453_12951 [Haloferax elongans ATCC BAA-1513]|uniref:Uncharacterized protein n=1 Tax=Haloferax elongans ATCC BAA-1513 TaxID=1230453 RepID=M0HIT2_HALEO|nr:hypothetical protein [Haloferax elongans]ELZ84455.1 hypothetical protein C453_12951 [Haloferax elongans ATCC BAA-1513]
MPISTLPSAKKFEEKGHAEVEFVGFQYVGDQSTKTDHDIRRRVGYSGPPKFQQGQVYFALLPTFLDSDHVANSNMGVHALEARNDFEVIYDAERLAEALLERNYLPPEVFYEGFDRYKRRKVLEKLDLDDAGRVFAKDDEEPYRDQLRAIAGIERDEAADVSQQRADEYVSRFSRSGASEIVKLLRQDADEIDLRTAGLTDMAKYLTRFDPAVVETAVDVVDGEADADDLDRVRAEAADKNEDEDEADSDADSDGEE